MCWHRFVRAIPIMPTCLNCGRVREPDTIPDFSELFEDVSALF
jgi:hypothetical protein